MNNLVLDRSYRSPEWTLTSGSQTIKSHRITTRTINSSRKPLTHHSSLQILNPPLTEALLKSVFKAKCEDIDIPINPEQELRFCRLFAKNLKTRLFHMPDSGLSLKSAKAIGQALKLTNFAYINLSKNSLSNQGAWILLKEIKSSTTIVHLDLSNNEITPEGIAKIAEVMKSHPSIISLDLASYEGLKRNRLGETGALLLADAVKNNSILQVLSLAGTGIGNGIDYLSKVLCETLSLLSLNLSNNGLVGKNVEELCEGLVRSNLQKLDLSWNKISDDGCNSLANMFNRSHDALCTLVVLNLSNCAISSVGIGKLFNSLRVNSFLRDLNLSGNNFIKGLSLNFGQFLIDNCHLQTLNLSNTSLKDWSLQIISDALRRNKTLKTLIISMNKLEKSAIECLSEEVKLNKGLKNLDLSACNIQPKCAIILCDALKKNLTLESVNLKDNNLKDDAGQLLFEATLRNRNLISINLEMNQLDLKYVEWIKRNLIKNQQQVRLQIVPRLIKEIEKIKVPIETYEALNEKTRRKLKKEKLRQKLHNKRSMSLEEVKAYELNKTKVLVDEYKALKNTNFELSKSLELIEIDMNKIKIQSQRKIEEFEMKIRVMSIEVNKALEKSKRYLEELAKENAEIRRCSLSQNFNDVKHLHQVEEYQKESAVRALNTLRKDLEEKKKMIELIKEEKRNVRIAPQFLASKKLAMDKKKYSPTKSIQVLHTERRSLVLNRVD